MPIWVSSIIILINLFNISYVIKSYRDGKRQLKDIEDLRLTYDSMISETRKVRDTYIIMLEDLKEKEEKLKKINNISTRPDI